MLDVDIAIVEKTGVMVSDSGYVLYADFVLGGNYLGLLG